jgi:hypothetical protein
MTPDDLAAAGLDELGKKYACSLPRGDLAALSKRSVTERGTGARFDVCDLFHDGRHVCN